MGVIGMRKLILLTVAVSLLHACCIMPKFTYSTEEMNRLEIAMRRLNSAVEGALWSGAPQDADLIAIACGTDPSLCNAIGKNALYSRVVDGNAVLLLCTPDGKRALVEDVACTPTPDYKAWAEKNAPCGFTVPDQAVRDACR